LAAVALNPGAAMTQGLLAGIGFELLRISASGVSVAGFPLKMMRLGF